MTLLLHNIGERITSNYNTREEIEASYAPLSFDGVYKSVYDNRDILKGRDVTLFIMGGYVGGDNYFDVGQPLEKLCTWDQIMELHNEYGCKLGWHTWSHPDLTKLSYNEILREVLPPFPMKYFAYPYGAFNETVIEAVRFAGFQKAWSVTQGDGSQFALKRNYLNW